MPRERLLDRVRTALGRTASQPIPAPPETWSGGRRVPEHELVKMFRYELEAAGGIVHVVPGAGQALAIVSSITDGLTSAASGSLVLREAGVLDLAGVRSGFLSETELRDTCRSSECGITSADFAIAQTGTLVLVASGAEPRMISMLPPLHIALLPRRRLVADLRELFERLPDPAAVSSALVWITGPSRTADIEQILVRGVHGPRALHVIVF